MSVRVVVMPFYVSNVSAYPGGKQVPTYLYVCNIKYYKSRKRETKVFKNMVKNCADERAKTTRTEI